MDDRWPSMIVVEEEEICSRSSRCLDAVSHRLCVYCERWEGTLMVVEDSIDPVVLVVVLVVLITVGLGRLWLLLFLVAVMVEEVME